MFLDLAIVRKLRDIVNDTSLCYWDDGFRKAHNLLCVTMDRVDDSGTWLNDHADLPNNVNVFILFLVHSDIVIKTVVALAEKLGVKGNDLSGDRTKARQYLVRYCLDALLEDADYTMVDDDLIWSYIRALTFAHTEETGAKRYYGKLLLKGEVQYSPFPVVDKYEKTVGVIVYSNKWPDTKSLNIPFDAMKAFVSSRYNLLSDIVRLAERRLAEKQHQWKDENIILDSCKNATDALHKMLELYVERGGPSYQFEFPLMCLEAKSTLKENEVIVGRYRADIANAVNEAKESFKKLDYNSCINTLDAVCRREYGCGPAGDGYYLQKVFTHLSLDPYDDKRKFAMRCAESLAKGFASEFVKIDVNLMSVDEIKMLLSVACYFKWQNKSIV